MVDDDLFVHTLPHFMHKPSEESHRFEAHVGAHLINDLMSLFAILLLSIQITPTLGIHVFGCKITNHLYHLITVHDGSLDFVL